MILVGDIVGPLVNCNVDHYGCVMHLGVNLLPAEAYYEIETIHLAMGRPAGMSALLPRPPMSGSSLEHLLRCFLA